MTIRQAIDLIDGQKPNQYSPEDKVRWLSDLDYQIFMDVILQHHPLPRKCDAFKPYTPDDMDRALIVTEPYTELYVAYIAMKIDEANGETARYNVSATMFNSYYENFTKFYNRHHRPVSHGGFRIY